MRHVTLMFVVLAFVSCSNARQQSAGKPDIDVQEASRIAPFPPRNVEVKTSKDKTIVTWEPIPLDNIVAYKVYRKTGDKSFVPVATVKSPPFIDKNSPHGQTFYSVSAINTYDAESNLAKPARKPN